VTARVRYPEEFDLPPGFSRLDAQTRMLALPAALRHRRYDLSVVVPVYNVEDYVERCLLSVDANRTAAIELIVINDGSRDRSLDVVLTCARTQLFHDVIVVDQPNADSSSAARNLGEALAAGEYVAYLDSDDFMEPGAYDRMLRQAQIHDADIVLCRTLALDDRTLRPEESYGANAWDAVMQEAKVKVTDAIETPALLAFEPDPNVRIVRRSLIENAALTFPVGLQFADLAVHTAGLLSARRIALVNACFHCRLMGHADTSTAARTRSRFDIVEVGHHTIERAREIGITPAQGRSIVDGLLRMLALCGPLVGLADRDEFYRRACRLFATIPSPWIRYAWHNARKPKRERRILRAFRKGYWRYLRDLSCELPGDPATALLLRLGRRIPLS
jgi:glycosyltransferase involved in cell wall biosynthesis